MVFKPFGTLARQSLAKFSNGYAQSAVAAAQSSYASSTTFPLTKLGHQFTPTKHHSTSSNQAGKRPEYTSISQRVNDSIALHNAFSTQAHEDDGQWRQFQYPKRILWSPATPLQQQQQQRESDVEHRQLGLRPEKPRAASMSSVREFSTSAFDRQQHQQPDNHAINTSEQAHLDLATSTKSSEPVPDIIVQDQEASLSQKDIGSASNAASGAPDASNDVTKSDIEPTASNLGHEQASQSASRELAQYHQNFEDSKNQGDFMQVMQVFERMKLQHIQPDVSAYNYYLHAISQVETIDRIPKLLATHDAMLSEGVQPSSYTYSILVFALVDWSEQIQDIIKRLETSEFRFGKLVIDHSKQIEALRAQDAITQSLELFRKAMKEGLRDLPQITYNYLVRALADTNKLDDMLYTLAQMEQVYPSPDLDTMAAMIKYFGRNQDINSAVECFTEATSRLVKDTSYADKVSLLNSSLLYAYFASHNEDHGLRFATKLQTSSDTSSLCIMVAQQYLEVKDVAHALQWTKGLSFENPSERAAINHTYMTAADADNKELSKSIQHPSNDRYIATSTAEAILASALRLSHWKTATRFLAVCIKYKHITVDNAPMIASAYAKTFIQDDQLDGGVEGFCKTMERVPTAEWNSLCERALDYLTDLLSTKGLLTQKQSLTLMRLIEGGRYSLPVDIARKLLVPFEGVPVKSLSITDFTTMVVAQSVSSLAPDASADEKAKLETMLVIAKENQLPLWNFPADMIQDFVPTPIENLSNDLQVWNSHFRKIDLLEDVVSFSNNSEVYHWSYRTDGNLPAFNIHQVLDEVDPYEKSLDSAGSGTLSALLDQPIARASGPENLKEILRLFERSKGHFQANAISRAIGTISRSEGTDAVIKFNVCYKIFQDALKAMPLHAEYRKSRYAWYLMYDAMIAASLNLDMPQAAAKLHNEMLAFGASPSANTYGLYIVNLKGASEIFDEATEALAIFERAKAEGVIPTSFLYNALIGKLAKARRVDDCLFYFSQMRAFGIRPTSVTYGTVVNALCRVSDERFAEELFDEMESMDNYRPRAAPYNSMLQFFVTTRRDRTKALKYYQRMKDHRIHETPYTWRLLIDCHAACEPIDMEAAEAVMTEMRNKKVHVSAIHYAALIHAKGCLLNDLDGAIQSFKDYQHSVKGKRALDFDIANVYQAVIESLVANNKIEDIKQYTTEMTMQGISMTPYIANSLIQGFANNGQIDKCEEIYNNLNNETGNSREPSTYEAMARAYVANNHHDSAVQVINEMASRGYPPPVMTRIVDALRNGGTHDVTLHK